MTYVVDACVAIKWYVDEADFEKAISILESDEVLFAPDLVLIETAGAASRKLRNSEISREQLNLLVEDLPRAINHIRHSAGYLPRAVELSIQLRHPVNDCLYLAVALDLGLRLITADETFADKINKGGLGERVLRLDDYRVGSPAPDGIEHDWTGADWFPKFWLLTNHVIGLFERLSDRRKGGSLEQWGATQDLVWCNPAGSKLRDLVDNLDSGDKVRLVATCLVSFHRNFDRAIESAERIVADPHMDLAKYLVRYSSFFHEGREYLGTRLPSTQNKI